MLNDTESFPFLKKVNSLFSLLNDKKSAYPYQKKAFEKFLGKGFPTQKEEVFNYVTLNRLKEWDFKPSSSLDISLLEKKARSCSSLFPEKDAYLVFVDGKFDLSLSLCHSKEEPFPGLSFFTKEEALKIYGSFFKKEIEASLSQAEDPLFLLQQALQEEAYFLNYSPKNKKKHFLHMLFLSTGKELLFPEIRSLINKNEELDLFITVDTLCKEPHYLSSSFFFHLEENSHCNVYLDDTALPPTLFSFDYFSAKLKKNSRFKSYFLSEGGSIQRKDFSLSLLEENSEGLLHGLYIIKEKNEGHAHVLATHKAPFCHSNQLFKNIVKDYAKASFEGKIKVDPLALKTEAYQLNENLILSPYAEIASKPNLEIFADDVKASHGSATGQLDQEALFYLQSRGLSKEEAVKILLYSFCEVVFDSIPYAPVKNYFQERLKTI